MELWFWAALLGAILAGVSNFYFKQAAFKDFNEEIFTLFGGLISIVTVVFCMFVTGEKVNTIGIGTTFAFLGGVIASSTYIMKVLALRSIDATIYFPLFKLLSPLLAIFAGVIFFNESFSYFEWVGMLLGLFVPLLLITKVEYTRQSNLTLGLILIVATGIGSAVTAALNKYATEIDISVLNILLYVSFGIFFGVLSLVIFKKGVGNFYEYIYTSTTRSLILGAFMRSSLISLSLGLMLYAYTLGGTLGVVQTIHSMYILIPVILAIYFYKEHWSIQKMLAVILSVVALAFFH
jgi:drug/metabolite transporter (DMT)-like permease